MSLQLPMNNKRQPSLPPRILMSRVTYIVHPRTKLPAAIKSHWDLQVHALLKRTNMQSEFMKRHVQPSWD